MRRRFLFADRFFDFSEVNYRFFDAHIVRFFRALRSASRTLAILFPSVRVIQCRNNPAKNSHLRKILPRVLRAIILNVCTFSGFTVRHEVVRQKKR